MICLDDYHALDRKGRKEKGVTALAPEAQDFELMYNQIKDMKAGKPVQKPIYNHVTGMLDPPEEIKAPKARRPRSRAPHRRRPRAARACVLPPACCPGCDLGVLSLHVTPLPVHLPAARVRACVQRQRRGTQRLRDLHARHVSRACAMAVGQHVPPYWRAPALLHARARPISWPGSLVSPACMWNRGACAPPLFDALHGATANGFSTRVCKPHDHMIGCHGSRWVSAKPSKC